MGKIIALPFGLLLLVSCQTASGSYCDIAKPIRLSPETIDQLSDREVADILALNEKGERLCRWKP